MKERKRERKERKGIRAALKRLYETKPHFV
jgi:hypothetical protein